MTEDEWDPRLVRSYVEGIHWNIDELYYHLQK